MMSVSKGSPEDRMNTAGSAASSSPKKPYVSPKLVAHGKLSEITRGSSGSKGDGKNSTKA